MRRILRRTPEGYSEGFSLSCTLLQAHEGPAHGLHVRPRGNRPDPFEVTAEVGLIGEAGGESGLDQRGAGEEKPSGLGQPALDLVLVRGDAQLAGERPQKTKPAQT